METFEKVKLEEIELEEKKFRRVGFCLTNMNYGDAR